MDGRYALDYITGARVYVDNYSGLTYSHLQTSLDTDHAIQSKLVFEANAYNMGVRVPKYRVDKGRFLEEGYRDAVSGCRQIIDYCGAGIHSQNGIIVRNIGLLTNDFRTLCEVTTCN